MLLSDWLLFFHKTIIALSGGHFEYFLSFPKKITLVYGLVNEYRIKKGLPTLPNFVNSAAYDAWKKDLYELRNKIIHAGWRQGTFELAKQAIRSCKAAIKEFEDHIAGLANTIQISPNVDHLENTAGRLKY
jgi:hypothetical protein